MNVTVIYGSDTGATQRVAKRIADKLQARAVDVKAATVEDFQNCDLLILGTPTYGAGDLQTDWEDSLPRLRAADLTHHPVALFGTGDQMSYPDSFVDAMGRLYEQVVEQGASVVGFTDSAGYDFTASLACRDGKFVGLAVDQDNQAAKTDGRIASWIEGLK